MHFARVRIRLAPVDGERFLMRGSGFLMTVCLVLLAMGGAGLVAAEPAVARVLIDGTAAYVNGHVITIGEVRAVMAAEEMRLFQSLRGEALRNALQALYAETLNTLIERRLILDAYALRDVQLPEAAVQERISEIIDNMFEGDRSRLVAALAEDHLSFEDWQDRVREQMIVSAMRAANVAPSASVSPLRVREIYASRVDALRQPAQVKLRMILLEGGSGGAGRKQAENVRVEILGGRPFDAVARLVSSGTHAEDGGDWGWIEPTKLLRPELAAAAMNIAPGVVSEVIELDGDFYLLLVEDRRAEHVLPLEEAQNGIIRELREQEAERLYGEWVERLKKDAYIRMVAADVF